MYTLHALWVGLLVLDGVSCAARVPHPPPPQPPEMTAPAPTWREQEIALRQTWDTLVQARARHERTAERVRAIDAQADAVRRLPWVSLTSGGDTTLAEAVALLLRETGYSVQYGPYVNTHARLAIHITQQRVDQALATLVHPLGYQASVDPSRRQVRIAAVILRQWKFPPVILAEQADTEDFWQTLHRDLHALAFGSTTPTASTPGFVRIHRKTGQVAVAAPLLQMPKVEAHLAYLSAAPLRAEEDP